MAETVPAKPGLGPNPATEPSATGLGSLRSFQIIGLSICAYIVTRPTKHSDEVTVG